MNARLPPVTIVIPARPGTTDLEAVSASRELEYPGDPIEILVARGRQPSVQRNLAVREARGEWIYFLDDDSCPERGNLVRAATLLERPDVGVIGGPALCTEGASGLERMFQEVMGSWLASGPSRARYRAVGEVRETGEKELILCNLLMRKRVFLEAGGFDEALYPNEENALMDTLRKRGVRLLYDPAFRVRRRPRRTLGAFARMVFGYGRGRAEQFRLHPTRGSLMNFVPPLFCLYLLATPWLPGLLRWGWAVYGSALLWQAAAARGLNPMQRMGIPPLIFLSHIGYGCGFWRGLTRRFPRPGSAGEIGRVELERVPTGRA
jgi:succinoglycan biosynthesis protein ExoA